MAEKFSLEERVGYLKEHGSHCMAYSTLQPGMKYFDLDGVGYLGYMEKWGSRFVLGNPISGKNDYEKIIGEALKEHKNTSFVQIDGECANVLADFGFYNTQMGIETWITLDDWSLVGNKKQLIRKYRNRGKKDNIVIKELTSEDYPIFKDKINSLKSGWFSSRTNSKKIRFLVRPESENEFDVKKFIATKDEELLAYTVCDPIYSNSKINGYNINLSFYSPLQKFKGVNYQMNSEILNVLKERGFEKSTLGLNPLAGIQKNDSDNPLLRSFLNTLYFRGSKIYNFKGIAEHKKEYCGENFPVYFSSKKLNPFSQAFLFFKVCNLI